MSDNWLRNHFNSFVFPAFMAAEKKSTEIGSPFHIKPSEKAPEELPSELKKLWTLCQDVINLCGQSVIAMLLDVELDEACKLVGHKRQTWTRDITRTLRAAGWQLPDKRIVISTKNPPTELCLLNMKWVNRQRHWVIKSGNEIYCSLGYDQYYYEAYKKHVRATSFLPLTPP